jgi:hypothetical protein
VLSPPISSIYKDRALAGGQTSPEWPVTRTAGAGSSGQSVASHRSPRGLPHAARGQSQTTYAPVPSSAALRLPCGRAAPDRRDATPAPGARSSATPHQLRSLVRSEESGGGEWTIGGDDNPTPSAHAQPVIGPLACCSRAHGCVVRTPGVGVCVGPIRTQSAPQAAEAALRFAFLVSSS